MSTVNIHTVKVSIKVLSIETDNHSCNAEITFHYEDKKEVCQLKNCFISGLAKYRFNDPENTKFIIGKEYTAENNSKNYDACPIKIKRTIGSSTGNLMYALTVLNEDKAIRTEISTPKGNIINGYTFRYLPKNKWIRYSDFYEQNRAKWLAKQEAQEV